MPLASLEIYPRKNRRPYYIYAPPYARTSAGIRTLHLLCHCLNLSGESAFVTTHVTNPELLTPPLTEEIVEFHFEKQRAPIAVYPEIIYGNPLKAPTVVRYLLNFPGLISGALEFDPNEICFGYSAELIATQDKKFEKNILFVPASDVSIFNSEGAPAERKLVSYYAGKYRDAFGGTVFGIPKDAVEIYGAANPHHPPQTQEEVAEIFRNSKFFYCWENTALATEAILCGCPAVTLPNEFLAAPIGANILGREGAAWGHTPEQLEWAQQTVGEFRKRYDGLQELFWVQLTHFRELTQRVSATVGYPTRVHFSANYKLRSGPDIGALPDGKLRRLFGVTIAILNEMRRNGVHATANSLVMQFRSGGRRALLRKLKASYFEFGK